MTVYPVSEHEIHDQAAAVTTKSWSAQSPKWYSYHGTKGQAPTLVLLRHLGLGSKLRYEQLQPMGMGVGQWEPSQATGQ